MDKVIYGYVQSNIWKSFYEGYYWGCLRINS